MSACEKEGKAVQIPPINDDHSFSLIENQLEPIQLDDRFKDKNVVVLSVAGDSRQGKSFLLACLLCFLLNQGRSNWLDDPSIPLGGFEWWPGSIPHTTGILLWNPPSLERNVLLIPAYKASVGAVERDCSFDGCLRDIDGKFKQKLQELVPWLLAPECLVVKEISRQKVTCQELMYYIRAYARTLQGGTLPLQRLFLQATAEASPLVAAEKATMFYAENIYTVPLHGLDKFCKAHNELNKRAMQLYRSTSKIGDGQDSQRYAEALRKIISINGNGALAPGNTSEHLQFEPVNSPFVLEQKYSVYTNLRSDHKMGPRLSRSSKSGNCPSNSSQQEPSPPVIRHSGCAHTPISAQKQDRARPGSSPTTSNSTANLSTTSRVAPAHADGVQLRTSSIGSNPAENHVTPKPRSAMTSENKGKPVQILRTNNDHGFTIDEPQLESILLDERVKDKKVAVVSVAGAYRQGKSFLLSFLLRFLWHQCLSSWLDDASIRLGGFEWSPGSKPHTTGILLWNEPFFVTTPTGEEVVVLLMDTQGSFDCKSSVKECTTIFALSIMISSVQVYNIFRNIQEDHLQHLQFFTEYSKLAKKETRKHMFQRLVFLVRDWACPYEAAYGADGGCAVLRDRLQIMDGQHTDLKTIRHQISSCFSKIDCFLMPRPGDKVETDMSFNGCLADIDGIFKEKLKEFVPWLLAPENLVVKEISGQKITCQMLMNFFRVYAKAFQGDALPPPKSVLQATAEASHMAAKEEAALFYLESMNKIPYGNLCELREAHMRLLNEAIEKFRTVSKFGDESLSRSYLETLKKDLQAHFNRLYKAEEQHLLREKEKEEQRQKEKEIERQREEERESERQRMKEKQEKLTRELQRQEEVNNARELQIEELKGRLSEAERRIEEKNKLAVAAEGLGLAKSICELATEITKTANRNL